MTNQGSFNRVRDSLKRKITPWSQTLAISLFFGYLLLKAVFLTSFKFSIEPYIKELNKNFRATMNYCEVDFSLRNAAVLSFESMQMMSSMSQVFSSSFDPSHLAVLGNYTKPEPASIGSINLAFDHLNMLTSHMLTDARHKSKEFLSHLFTSELEESTGIHQTIYRNQISLKWPIRTSLSGSNYFRTVDFIMNTPAACFNFFNMIEQVVIAQKELVGLYFKSDESLIPEDQLNQNPLYRYLRTVTVYFCYNIYSEVFQNMRQGFLKIQHFINESQTSKYDVAFFAFIFSYAFAVVLNAGIVFLSLFKLKSRMMRALACYIFIKDEEITAQLAILSKAREMFTDQRFNERQHLKFFTQRTRSYNRGDFIANQFSAGGLGTSEKSKAKQSRRQRSFRQIGFTSGLAISLIANTIVLILFLILFTFIFIMKSKITDGNFLRNMQMEVCIKSMDVNNNILGAYLYAVRGRQVSIELQKIESDTYRLAPEEFAAVIMNSRERLLELSNEQESGLKDLLLGNLCTTLHITEDYRQVACGSQPQNHLLQGIVGLMYWMRDSTKRFRDEMRSQSSVFLEYSDGLPILGEVAVSRQPVMNEVRDWYSSTFVDFRYSSNLAWKPLQYCIRGRAGLLFICR